MSRRRRIYEGKAKVLFEGPEPGTLVQYFKDDATAFNNQKRGIITGKGVLNNRISEYLMQRLNEIGVPTHFLRRLNMREQLVREVEIIPLEVVVRNVAAGSLAKRFGIAEGTQLPRSIIEFYYKSDELGDPDGLRGAHHRLRLGQPAGHRRDHGAVAAHQRLPLRPVPRRRHEAGRLQARVRPPLRERGDAHRPGRRDQPGQLPAVGRARPTRRSTRTASASDLGKVAEAYQEVARRLGILPEAGLRDMQGPDTVQ